MPKQQQSQSQPKPQRNFFLTEFDYTQQEHDDRAKTGHPPAVGFYEPGIPIDGTGMYLVRGNLDYLS